MTKAFVSLLFFLSFFLQAKEKPSLLHYNYKVTQNGTSYGRTLTLEKNTTHIKIEANDEKNGNEKILLSKETEKLLEAQYEEPGQKILTIFVDNIGKKVFNEFMGYQESIPKFSFVCHDVKKVLSSARTLVVQKCETI